MTESISKPWFYSGLSCSKPVHHQLLLIQTSKIYRGHAVNTIIYSIFNTQSYKWHILWQFSKYINLSTNFFCKTPSTTSLYKSDTFNVHFYYLMRHTMTMRWTTLSISPLPPPPQILFPLPSPPLLCPPHSPSSSPLHTPHPYQQPHSSCLPASLADLL